MIPGGDSYVTMAEANAYAAEFHPDIDWLSLTEKQREQRLVLACERLEALPFPGRKSVIGQALSFPRFPKSEVPQSIRAAQVEIALLSLRADTVGAGEAEGRAALQRQGVTAFSIGDLSESYGGTSGLVSVHGFLADATIYGLLARFLRGGYAIC